MAEEAVVAVVTWEAAKQAVASREAAMVVEARAVVTVSARVVETRAVAAMEAAGRAAGTVAAMGWAAAPVARSESLQSPR